LSFNSSGFPKPTVAEIGTFWRSCYERCYEKPREWPLCQIVPKLRGRIGDRQNGGSAKRLFTGFFSQVSWAEIRAALSGSAGVLAYFFLAYYLFATTLCLVVHLVSLPLLFIGFLFVSLPCRQSPTGGAGFIAL
jgi:hypothetical protein